MLDYLTGFAEEQVLSMIITIAASLFSLVTAYAVVHISSLADKLKEKTNIEIVNGLIDRVNDLVVTTVLSLEQTVAKELREQVKNGFASREELLQVGRNAVQRVLEELGEDARTILEDTVGDLEGFVTDKVEGTVQKLKLNMIGPDAFLELKEGKN